MNPKILPGANVQRLIYDELADFYSIGQKALIFQQQATGQEPVKSVPWAWANEIVVSAGSPNFYSQLQDDFNLTSSIGFSTSIMYFGYVTASVHCQVSPAGGYLNLFTGLYPFQGVASSIFGLVTTPLLVVPMGMAANAWLTYQSSTPLMFNYLQTFFASPSAGQVTFDLSFYGQQISI